ncbi:MAG: PilZ domain-containing protein [Proteobacteria bacterium]|jgi:hypothetical protein|nr:PilZ domain-containing protein [Pseudomonadota bacterium]
MSNKRKEQRTPRKVLVCFEGEDFSIYSKTRDISEHGAFISTHYILTPGTEITLHLEAAQPIEKKARVVHLNISGDEKDDVDNTGFGVEFLV